LDGDLATWAGLSALPNRHLADMSNAAAVGSIPTLSGAY
jgi:hypothetical protein